MLTPYSDDAPERDSLDAAPGPMIVEFGSNSCGICQAAVSWIDQVITESGIPHLRIQDGKGRRLGRQFGVKLWPTLVFLSDGKEVARVVRPTQIQELRDAVEICKGQ